MKKIALLHYAYPPNIGGVEILLSEQALILAEHGYDVLVLTGSGKSENSKIKLIEAPILQSILKINPLLQQKIVEKGIVDDDFHKLAAEIEKLLDDILFYREIIIVHNMLTLVHNLPFIQAFKNFVAKNPQKKIIVWAHDQTFIDGEKILDRKDGVNLSNELKTLLKEPVARATYVVISETFKKLLIQVMDLSQNKVEVIPNGINIKRFMEIDDSIWDVCKTKKWLSKFPLILAPVNLLPRKNLEYGLKTAFYLKKNYPDLCLIISGKASIHRETDSCLSLLKKNVRELEFVDNVVFLADYFDRSLVESELHDLYDLADLVFYFSRSENFGLPILESYLAKTPAFISNLQVFHEIEEKDLNFIDIASTGPEICASLIQRYLETDRTVLMNKLVRQKYNLETIIETRLLPLFEKP